MIYATAETYSLTLMGLVDITFQSPLNDSVTIAVVVVQLVQPQTVINIAPTYDIAQIDTVVCHAEIIKRT
jgi:hypothetical protein